MTESCPLCHGLGVILEIRQRDRRVLDLIRCPLPDCRFRDDPPDVHPIDVRVI